MSNTNRKLATVDIITDIEPIKGADFIEVGYVRGWQVVVKKGAFVSGDKCAYFEIDSVLPDVEVFEFMRERKFRVKTIKLRKTVSQGLALPISEFPGYADKPIGYDLTDALGVTKYISKSEAALYDNKKKKPVRFAWMLKYKPLRGIHHVFFGRKTVSREFPDFIPKTDEVRVQNIRNFEKYAWGEIWTMTEKLDGCSMTVFCKHESKKNIFGVKKHKYTTGVCSRNVLQNPGDNSKWNTMNNNRKISKKLEAYCKATRDSLAIQGELCGPGIQGNPYNLENMELFVFSIYDIEYKVYLPSIEVMSLCDTLGLLRVPMLGHTDAAMTAGFTVPYVVDYVNGTQTVLTDDNSQAEGIVFRNFDDPSESFKVINNTWLLKHE